MPIRRFRPVRKTVVVALASAVAATLLAVATPAPAIAGATPDCGASGCAE